MSHNISGNVCTGNKWDQGIELGVTVHDTVESAAAFYAKMCREVLRLEQVAEEANSHAREANLVRDTAHKELRRAHSSLMEIIEKTYGIEGEGTTLPRARLT